MDQAQVENKVEQPQADIATTPQTSQQPIQDIKVSPENDANWKKFREDRERDRKAAEEATKRAAEKEAEAAALKAAMEAILNKPSQQQYQEQYEGDETEDQKIEKRVNQILDQRHQQSEQERVKRDLEETPQRLRQAYSDFNQVCSTENLDYLEYHYPEVATPYKHMPDTFEKWTAIYKAVKRFVANTDSRNDEKKADKNQNKPQSLSSSGMTISGNSIPPSRLDEKKKADNWNRMQRLLKGLN